MKNTEQTSTDSATSANNTEPSAQDELTKAFAQDAATEPAPAHTEPAQDTAPAADSKKKTTPKAEKPASLLEKALGKKEPPKEQSSTQDGDPSKEEFPEDKLELPSDAPEDKKSQFKSLRDLTKGLRTRIGELETQLKTGAQAQPDATSKAELETLRREKRELSEKLASINIREHPEYVKNFTAPKKQAADIAASILKDYGIDAPDLDAVFSKPRAEAAKIIQELVADMPEMDKMAFISAASAFRDTAYKEQQALKNATDIHKTLGAQREHRQREAFNSVFADDDQTGFLTTLSIDENADDDEKTSVSRYNEGLKLIRGVAEKYAFAPIDDRQMAMVAKKAAMLDFIMEHGMPRLEAEYGKVIALNTALAKKLDGLKAARSTGTAAGDADSDGGELSAQQELERAFSG